MTNLAWSHACVVGVRAMDDQHGILMDTLNELRLQLMRGTNAKEVREHLGCLVEFTRLHFDCEELLLERHGFPALQQHRAAHQHLMDEIRPTLERAERGETADFHRLLGFLRGWFLDHIEGLDHQYGEWLNDQGIY